MSCRTTFLPPSFGFRASAFGLLSSFVIRHSSFAFAATNSDEIPPLRPPRDLIPPTYWEQHSTAIILLTIVGLAALVFCLWLILRPKAPIVVPPEVQAREALEPLRGQPEDGALLSRVSQILRRYLAAAFNLPPEEMTTTEFCATLTASPRIGPEL